ncbi:deoxyguanosinetriphosphate triphosphohydrolase [Desulfobacterota bacterium]|nr:deoxyguanosinetriphosphate triphosphohydrolase [Thermodesulfobacteriota bacterium]
MINSRKKLEVNEKSLLSQYAALSSKSVGRAKKEKKCTLRTEYQRDRDRIIHSKSFRRLKDKTQVFLAPYGDHFRTRLTHVLEVSQISRTISRSLSLNEDLSEAIALGHDLGHTPFGHAGEQALDKIHKKGFKHYMQSLRIVEFLEKNGKGLNLTFEVKDGISKHSKGTGPIVNKRIKIHTLEGQVVRLSDIFAYFTHDLDDALRSSLIKKKDIPLKLIRFFGEKHSERISKVVSDTIENTININYKAVAISKELEDNLVNMRSFLFEKVYYNPVIKVNFEKAKKVLMDLYSFFLVNEKALREFYKFNSGNYPDDCCDFIAGMSDDFALEIHKSIFIPKKWSFVDFKV